MLSKLIVLSGCLSVLMLSGCGVGAAEDQPEVATVEGIVLVDGSPKANLQIVFTPTVGRPSQGITDDKGHYSLSYIGATAGAKIDSHKVQITTMDVPTSDRIEEQVPFKETIPKNYNATTTLTATVNAGENVIDFSVQTK